MTVPLRPTPHPTGPNPTPQPGLTDQPGLTTQPGPTSQPGLTDRSAPAARRGWAGRAEPLFGLLTVAVAATSFHRFYSGWIWWAALAGAAAVGTALAWATARRPLGWVVAAGALGAVASALFLCYPTATRYGLPGREALAALGTGLTSGWARMLTVALPADPAGDLLVTPVVAAFVAAFVTTGVLARTRWVFAVAAAPLALFTAGLLVSAEHPGRSLPATAALLVTVLVVLLVRVSGVTAAERETVSARDADAIGLDLAAQWSRAVRGRAAIGVPVVAAATALALTGAWLLPLTDGADRFDPGALRPQHHRIDTALTPLAEVRPQLEGAPRDLFTVRVGQSGGGTTVDRVRVAALDEFDGAIWSQSRDFQVTGSTLPAGPPVDDPAVTLDLDIDVDRLPGVFLPVAGTPVATTATDVAYDPRNGTLVSTRPTVTDYRYRVTALARPLGRELVRARESRTPQDAAYRELPHPPPWVARFADQVMGHQSTPYYQLTELEGFLRGDANHPGYTYSLNARPGHSYGAVHRVLAGPVGEQGVGYAEQFASAFALLARAKGYPTRVAVGYRLDPAARHDGAYRVTTRHAHAWPEVHLAGFGWVPFEPTRFDDSTRTPPPRDRTAPVPPADPPPPARPPQQEIEPDTRAQPAQAGDDGPGGLFGTYAAVSLGALLLLAPVLAVLLLLGARWLRRRLRRTRGTPAQRITAAWREAVDRLRGGGLPVDDTHTPVRVAAELADGSLGGPAVAVAAPPLAELAVVVTTAICAPDEPRDEAATHAWHLEQAFGRALGTVLPPRTRLRALLDPRSLLTPRAAARRPNRTGPGARRGHPTPTGARR